MTRKPCLLSAALVAVLSTATTWAASDASPKADKPAPTKTMDAAHRAKAEKLIDGGLDWLIKNKLPGGGWNIMGKDAPANPAITAMVLKALVQHPKYDMSSPVVKRGFEALLKYRQKDGGIYNPRMGQQNYTTAVSVMALAAAKNPKFKSVIDDAVKYLKGLQIVPGSESPDGKKIAKDHPFVGGVSYGKHGRPDLSNLGLWMQAMEEAGVPSNDPAVQRALIFVTATQNLSETNPRPWAKVSVNDGGFVYAPATATDITTPESKGGQVAGGGWRSYGSMTYTGFKSLLYSGLDRKDPRVRAAFQWIRTYFRLDSNPNMPQKQSNEGLYYYYHVFAKALRAWGQPVITDRKGVKHNWREELIDTLAKQVGKDGTWKNPEPRWYEKYPVLATSYSVLALQETLKK